MSHLGRQLRQSVNGSRGHPMAGAELLTTITSGAETTADDRPSWGAHRRNWIQLSASELALTVGITGVSVIGWLALILAQLGRLTLSSLLLALGLVAATVGVFLRTARPLVKRRPESVERSVGYKAAPHERGFDKARKRLARSAFSLVKKCVRRSTWHDALLGGLLLTAAFLYTPPADYAPAFLDAGWYTSTGALIARTGELTARPDVLEALPAADRGLFIRTYSDHRSSMPRFPDRDDVGFYNLAFAADLERNGAVAPYHPPFVSVWIAVLRLVGGPALGAYAAPMFGLLFVLAVYTAGRAIFGPNIALVGALLTALAPPIVYYARTPFAELLAGALIWAGVYALTRYATHSVGRDGISPSQFSTCRLLPTDDNPSARSGGLSPTASGKLNLAFAGLALGVVPLVKFEGLLLLPAVGLFWIIWLRRRWATRREFATFSIPFGALSAHVTLLYATTLRPYVVLNGHGLWSLLATTLSNPSAWVLLIVFYTTGIAVFILLRQQRLEIRDQRLEVSDCRLDSSRNQPPTSNLQETASLIILAGAGITLVLAWPAAQANVPSAWSGLVTLSLFLTPLGLCLGVVGLSHLAADDLSRRTAFLVMALGTAGLVTVMMPAISNNVSHLYTVRRQLPIVAPALLLLTAYVTLRWAGLAHDRRHLARQSAGLRRGLAILTLALLTFNFIHAGRSLIRQPELAGSSTFVARLTQTFAPESVVLFESVDRGAHVGRFAAPLWAEHGVSAMLLSSTHPPREQLTEVVRRWQHQGRRVYFVSESYPPPFTLPDAPWTLVEQQRWAGATMAANMTFPPETWVLEVPFYIYEADIDLGLRGGS